MKVNAVDSEKFKLNFPDATVPSGLQGLLAFQNAAKDWYSGHFQLIVWPFGKASAFGGDNAAAEQFVVFGRGPDGSLYAFWKYSDRPVDNAPVVFLGSEGTDWNLLASDLKDFLSLLAVGADELGSEASWGQVKESKPPAPRLNELRHWLQKSFSIEQPKDPMDKIESARQEHPDFPKWFSDWQSQL